jgi:uncharacterized protein (DUF1778 family)
MSMKNERKRLKPGPKPKPPEQVRLNLCVRLLPAERAALDEAARKADKSVTAYMRDAALDKARRKGK